MAFGDWWGMGGSILGVLFFPGPIIFPFVAWIVEGGPNGWYFLAWTLGAIGVIHTLFTNRMFENPINNEEKRQLAPYRQERYYEDE